MAKEHISAGTEVKPGIYRCNACANEHECSVEGEKLPLCCICDSASWQTYRLAQEKQAENKS
ncbi:MAG: hypothetical protein AB9873_12040 [Syntrophobacteraceae bacterium]